MNFLKITAASAALVAAGASAQAATVDITLTEYDTVGEAVAAWGAFIGGASVKALEEFEGFNSYSDGAGTDSTGNTALGLETAIGYIDVIGPAKSGGSAVAPLDEAVVRQSDGANFGRFDADTDVTEDGQWLDSNDNSGLKFTIPGASGLPDFDKFVMILTDIDDVGPATFDITAFDGLAIGNTVNSVKQGNGDIFLATFAFSELVSDVTIEATIDAGDGFGVDAIGVAAVPLPAAGWLLLAGLGGLAAARRRKS